MIPRARLSVFSALLSLGLAANVAQATWPHDPFVNVRLAPSVGNQQAPAIVSDGIGGAIVAWSDGRSGNFDIYAQHVTAAGVVDGAWPVSGLLACGATGDQTNPVMVSDGAGGAFIAWTDRRFASGDIFAQHVTAAGSISPGWPADGRELSVASESADEYSPQIVTDGSGGAIVVWSLVAGTFDTDIYGARVNGLGTVLWSEGLYFPLGVQDYPSAVSDGAGGVIVAFEDDSGASADILALRVNSFGNVLWFGTSVYTGAGAQRFPLAASDGFGGAYVVWYDYSSGNADIMGARLSSSGAASNRFIINNAAGDQTNAVMAATANHGAIVAFYDVNSHVVYAHHITQAGVDPSWPTGGLPITFAASYAEPNGIASDGSGGAIVGWVDSRNSFGNALYATRITGSGIVPFPWVEGGNAVCTVPPGQSLPVVADDGNGDGIFAWEDYRDNNVFAQNIDRFGQLGDASPSFVSLRDVRGDQGGQVRLVWNASYLDADPGYAIGEYWVWRQTSPSLAADAVRAGARWLDGDARALPAMRSDGPESGRLFMRSQVAAATYTWEFLAAQKASGFPQYSYVASTARDSLGGSNPYTAFMVQARAAGGVAFWNSAPDSTYSVDNLPPLPPSSLSGAYGGGATHLHWAPNHESDLAGYRLYRGASAGFMPAPSNLVASPADTGYADPGAAGGFYKLSAVDINGNESGFALLTPSGTLDVGDETPREVALALASPNPARGTVSFRVSLPAPGRVSLAVYDAAGRLVRQLIDGEGQAGERIELWDGGDSNRRRCANGLYFAVLHASDRKIVRRIVIAR